MSDRKSSPKAGPSNAPRASANAELASAELSRRERAERTRAERDRAEREAAQREATQRDKALKAIVQHYTANPEFRDVVAMQTLASANKEFSKIWKDMLPSMKEKLPARLYSRLFNVPFPSSKPASQIIELDICVFGSVNPECVDSHGEKAITLTKYLNLPRDDRSKLDMDVARRKRTRIMQYIMRNAQIGDMYVFQGNRHVIVDEPSLDTKCVVRVPQTKISLGDGNTLYVFFLPAEITKYMIKTGIAPLGSNKQLSLPEITGEPIVASVGISQLVDYGNAECKNQRSMIMTVVKVDNGVREEAHLYPLMKGFDISASKDYQLILFQHPRDPTIFFDVSGTLFKKETPQKFLRSKPVV